ncbi:unnamed protein product [Mycena citricolor]|uniref:Uncharacterized protein n=1 Tax=Mycena citricolor TaxID=2018698 RepID=A0AAD2K7X9_9AGAR|nr:unnamed protein product [Mycena citricolor]
MVCLVFRRIESVASAAVVDYSEKKDNQQPLLSACHFPAGSAYFRLDRPIHQSEQSVGSDSKHYAPSNIAEILSWIYARACEPRLTNHTNRATIARFHEWPT